MSEGRMGKALEAAAATLRARLGGEPFDGAVHFEIEGEGVICVAGREVSTAPDPGADLPDVTISATLETFRQVFEGVLSPATAFMTGKMRVEGDFSTALKLGQLLG